MRRAAFVTAVALACVVRADAQSSVYSAAIPPNADQLDRLRLKTEWAIHAPIDGRTDSVTQVQVADGDQMFVQTKSGSFLALDGRTGERLWSYRFPNSHVTSYPVALNSRYVFVANLSSLYCFHRYSGLLEFAYEPTIRLGLPLATISAGPVCDESHVYVVLGHRDVIGYELPSVVKQPDPAASKEAIARAKTTGKAPNPADQVANRYPGKGEPAAQEFETTPSRGLAQGDINVSTKQVAVSLTALPSVNPPYQLRDQNGLYILRTESLTPLNTLRHPYRIRDGEGRYVVKTPSITVVPPSVHQAFALNDIRPKGLEPKRQFIYEATNRVQYEPILAGPRLWLTFQSPRALAFDRLQMLRPDRTVQTDGTLSSPAAAAMMADGQTGYLPLQDGSLVAIDLNYGGVNNMGALKQLWRANVGGPMNRRAVITSQNVFVGGDVSGVSRINRKAGELDWRTASEDDFLLAVNDESVYTRSAKGVVRVYDLNAPTDPITKQVVPIGELALPGFGIPVANAMSDRIILASDNGLIICLRDSATKYVVPKSTLPKVAPPAAAKVEKKEGDTPMTPAAPKSPMADPAK